MSLHVFVSRTIYNMRVFVSRTIYHVFVSRTIYNMRSASLSIRNRNLYMCVYAAQEASWERGFDPVSPFCLDLYQ